MAEPGTVFKNAEQGSRLATANAKFALDLYQRQTAATTGNIFMSPLSISVALAMTYLGARGNTKTQMKDVMRFGEVEEEHLHQTFSDIRSALNKPDQPYTLYMANRLFGEKSYTFLQEFLSLGQQHYGAELAPVDFRNDAAGAVALINNWVAQNTNSKITELVPLSAVDELTRLILVNAVYFKGDWSKKFDKQNTKDEDFHVSASEKVKVKLMHMAKAKLNYGYNNDLKSQAIELPYAGETLSMFIVLPDHTVTNLSELEKKITVETLTQVRNTFRMSNREVHLWLPRFRLDEKLSLVEILTAMGMGDLFDKDRVDLSGVDGKGDLVVSKVLHRAVVDVNEEGTEAAAATAVVMMMRCAMIPKDPFEFRADRPFLFFIQDNRTGSVLFLGRVVKPEAVSSRDEL